MLLYMISRVVELDDPWRSLPDLLLYDFFMIYDFSDRSTILIIIDIAYLYVRVYYFEGSDMNICATKHQGSCQDFSRTFDMQGHFPKSSKG